MRSGRTILGTISGMFGLCSVLRDSLVSALKLKWVTLVCECWIILLFALKCVQRHWILNRKSCSVAVMAFVVVSMRASYLKDAP